MKGLSFRLLSAKADGGEASVKAEITNYAMYVNKGKSKAGKEL